MARRTKAEAERTCRLILEASVDVFSEKGYSHTTFEDIAQRIGMTKGAVYWHYKNKAALVAALFDTLNARENLLLAASVPEINSLDDLYASLVARIWVATKDEQCRKLAFFVSEQMEWSAHVLESVQEESKKYGTKPFEEVGEVLRKAMCGGLLRANTDTDAARDILISMYLGILTSHFQGISNNDPVEMAEQAFQILIQGLKA